MAQAARKSTTRRKAKKVNWEKVDAQREAGRTRALHLVDEIVSHVVEFDGYAPLGMAGGIVRMVRRGDPEARDEFMRTVVEIIAKTCTHSTAAEMRMSDALWKKRIREDQKKCEAKDAAWRKYHAAAKKPGSLLVTFGDAP